jgi:putative transcriptional regulator
MSRGADPTIQSGKGPAHTVRSLLETGSITRLMVLRALARDETSTLRRIAEEIGVTVQAVSEHLKRLTTAGLVSDRGGGHRLTREGHEALAAQLDSLKRYVDGALRDLARVETTAARAGANLTQGDPVGLFMQDGELVARPMDSPSRGVALQDAAPGEDVLVGELEGIVDLEPGSVTFLVVPDAHDGGSRRVDAKRAARLIEKAGIVATHGPVARHVAEQTGAKPVRLAAAAVAAEAAMVGIDAIILVEASRLDEMRSRLDRVCEEWGFEPEVRVERAG